MWEAAALMAGVLISSGLLMRGYTWWVRERAVRSIPEDARTRAARGVSMRVMVRGETGLPGMNPRKANRTRGDLILTADRFLLASGRGTLLDLRPGRGRPMQSARSTGPGRLILEGEVPNPRGVGRYRVEIQLPDAAGWAEALEPFVSGDGRYAVVADFQTDEAPLPGQAVGSGDDGELKGEAK